MGRGYLVFALRLLSGVRGEELLGCLELMLLLK
jgi:hypothetical protein